jgi:hypothetical protein
MTTLAISQFLHRTPEFLTKVGHSFQAFFDGIGEARAMAHDYQTLSRMSDRELASHGLKRDEIPQAVLSHRPRS